MGARIAALIAVGLAASGAELRADEPVSGDQLQPPPNLERPAWLGVRFADSEQDETQLPLFE